MIKPTKNQVLIKPVEDASVTTGGIIIPETLRSKAREGQVIAIGKTNRPLDFEVGSWVFITMYGGVDVNVDGPEYRLVKTEEIIGVSKGGGFHPVGNKILVRPLDYRNQGKLIIPGSADEDETIRCVVHLLGSGIETKKGKIIPFEVKTGDVVLINRLAGKEVNCADGKYKLIEQFEIEAVLERFPEPDNFSRDFENARIRQEADKIISLLTKE